MLSCNCFIQLSPKNKEEIIKIEDFIKSLGIDYTMTSYNIDSIPIIDESLKAAVGFTLKDLKKTCRNRRIVYARMALADMLYRFGATTIYIGYLLNKDHSTVSYYMKQLNVEYGINKELTNIADVLRKEYVERSKIES